MALLSFLVDIPEPRGQSCPAIIAIGGSQSPPTSFARFPAQAFALFPHNAKLVQLLGWQPRSRPIW
eukprot:2311084-Prorocentrum_lima.AAC.1